MSTLTIQQALDLALAHHRSGRLREAQSLYKQILVSKPQHVAAIHNLGLIAQHFGKKEEALALLRRAISLRPDFAEAHSNLGAALRESGQLDEAIAACTQSIALDPKLPKSHYNLGNALRDKGNLDESIKAFREAIALNPAYSEAHAHLGLALSSKGFLDQAIAAYRRAIELNPRMSEAHNNLGDALSEKGKLRDAAAALRRALELNPNYATALNNLGMVLKRQRQWSAAIAAFRAALEIEPDLAEIHNNLGAVLGENGQIIEAIECYRKSIALRPDLPEAYNNLGVTLADNEVRDQGIASPVNAATLQPDFAKDHSHLRIPLFKRRNFDEAIACYRKAIALKPSYDDAHYNLAMILLRRGDFAAGWEEHEWRLKSKNAHSQERYGVKPRWDGSSLEGRTLLVHDEQGLGDTLQFIRYLPLIASLGGKIVLESPMELQRIVRWMAIDLQLVARGDSLPSFDFHCPMMSLPLVFKTTLESIPAQVPYISPDLERVESWRERLPALADSPALAWRGKLGAEGSFSKVLNVGLVWAGNPNHKSDRTRSIPLDRLTPLGKAGCVVFHSLQKGEAAKQADNPPAALPLIHLSPQLADFTDTAAVLSLMDLLITVDTSVAHLAGALGCAVWLLLPCIPDWRWLLDREDTPWYPSMRLFRQHRSGDWDSVIARVALALSDFH